MMFIFTVKILYVILSCLIFFRYTRSLRFGIFSKTNIIRNTCDETQVIKVMKNYNHLYCSLACSLNNVCRRFLFCSDDKTCRLYRDGTDCILSPSQTDCSCYQKTIGCDENNNCTCPVGYYGDNCQHIIMDCSEGAAKGIWPPWELLTIIKPLSSPKPFEVHCYMGPGGYTSILTRVAYCEYEDFNRTLEEYEVGFGKVYLNRWIGLTNILHILGNPHSSFEMTVQLQFFNSQYTCFNHYRNFEIGNKSSNYVLSVDDSSHCGDSIKGNVNLVGRPFSTYDADFTYGNNCAMRFGGGWWFADSELCTQSFLTGSTVLDKGVYLFWKDRFAGSQFSRVSMKLKRE